jgi:hypothetical protein
MIYTYGIGKSGLLAALFFLSTTLFADQVPTYLVDMSVDLLAGTRDELQKTSAQEDPDGMIRRTQQILRKNGLYNWGRSTQEPVPPVLTAAEKLDYELEKNGAGQHSLQSSSDILMDAITGWHGETEYVIEGRESGQSIRLRWNPDENQFTIVVQDKGDGEKTPFLTEIKGKLWRKRVFPAKESIKTLNKQALEEQALLIRDKLIGDWIDQQGHHWKFETTGKGEILQLPLRITHYYPDSVALNWTGKLDSNQIFADRKALHIHDTREKLPMAVRKQIVSNWQPDLRLELSIRLSEEGYLQLEGKIWKWHVTYDSWDYSIKRIHTEYSEPLILRRKAKIKSLEFTKPDPPYAPFDWILEGDDGYRFRVRVIYEEDPQVEKPRVKVTSADGKEIWVEAKPLPDFQWQYLTGPIKVRNCSLFEDNP